MKEGARGNWRQEEVSSGELARCWGEARRVVQEVEDVFQMGPEVMAHRGGEIVMEMTV